MHPLKIRGPRPRRLQARAGSPAPPRCYCPRMPAQTIEHLTLPMPPEEARALVLAALGDMPKYKLVDQDEALGLVRWRKGFGFTNPVTIEARFQPEGAGTAVELKAMVLALMDPFGFTKEAAQIAAGQVRAHLAARETGAAVPAAPAERRGLMVNVVFIGFAVLMMGCACGGVVLTALLGG